MCFNFACKLCNCFVQIYIYAFAVTLTVHLSYIFEYCLYKYPKHQVKCFKTDATFSIV